MVYVTKGEGAVPGALWLKSPHRYGKMGQLFREGWKPYGKMEDALLLFRGNKKKWKKMVYTLQRSKAKKAKLDQRQPRHRGRK